MITMKALLLAPLLLSSVAAQVLGPQLTPVPTPLGPVQRPVLYLLRQQVSNRRDQLSHNVGGQFGGTGPLQSAPSPQGSSQLNNVIPPSQSTGSQPVPSTQPSSGKQPLATPTQSTHQTSGQRASSQNLTPPPPLPTQNLAPSPPRPTSQQQFNHQSGSPQQHQPSPQQHQQSPQQHQPSPQQHQPSPQQPLPHATVTQQSAYQPQTPHSQLPPGTGHQVSPQVPHQLSLAQRRRLCGKLPDPGECRGAFPRYYYNAETSQCDCFLYGGCGALESSYATLRECHEVCAPAILSEGPSCRFIFQEEEEQFFFPPLHQGPVTAQVNKTTSQQENKTPQVVQPSGGANPGGGITNPSGGVTSPIGGVTNPSGGVTRPSGGANPSAGATPSRGANPSGVEADSSERGSELHPLCRKAPDFDHCKDLIPRYYYNPTTGQCRSSHFIHCKGPDQSGFATLNECTNACRPSDY